VWWRRCDSGSVRIEIWVDEIDPPTGRVSDMPFRGWIDLLAVLSRVLETVGDEKGELDPRAQPELGQDV